MATVIGLNLVAQPQAEAYSLVSSCKWASITNLTWANFDGTTGVYATAMNTASSRWASATAVDIDKIDDYYYASFAVNSANFGNVDWSGRAPNFDVCPPSGYYPQAMPLQLNKYYLADYSATERAMVAAHEVGHNLGLRHVGGASTACGSVALMNPGDSRRITCGVYGPKADDVNGINAKY